MKQHQRTYRNTHYTEKNSGLSLTLENGIRLSIIWGEMAMCRSDSVEVMPFVADGYYLCDNAIDVVIPGYTDEVEDVVAYLPVREIPALIEAALTVHCHQ